MSFEVIATNRFAKELKQLVRKYPSLKIELATLIEDLEKSPAVGTSLGKNCFKIRLAISSKGKGKSGGARVITHVYYENEIVYLLSIYDKSEKPDLKPNELDYMIGEIDFD